jgi:hypothetical protein
MTEYFCNECSTNKKKGCTIKWPSSWDVNIPPRGGMCDSENPRPKWCKVTRKKYVENL